MEGFNKFRIPLLPRHEICIKGLFNRFIFLCFNIPEYFFQIKRQGRSKVFRGEGNRKLQVGSMAHVGYNVKDAQHHLIACFHPPPIRKIERNILQRLHNRCADNKKEENEKEGLKEGKGNQRTAECNDDRSQHSKRIDAFYCYLQVCN